MTGASKVISLRETSREESVVTEALAPETNISLDPEVHTRVSLPAEDYTEQHDYETVPKQKNWARLLTGVALVALGAAWTGLVVAHNVLPADSLPSWTVIALQTTPIVAAPLGLLAVLWLLLRRPANGFAGIGSNNVANWAALANSQMESIQAQLEENAALMSDRIDQLEAVGSVALQRVGTLRATLNEEIGQISVQTHQLKNAAAAARSDMAVLMSNLPKAQVETRKIVIALQDAGVTAFDRATDLAVQLEKVVAHSQSTQVLAQTAVATLASHISVMDEHAASAQRQVELSRSALDKAHEESGALLQRRVTALTAQIDELGNALHIHDDASERLTEKLRVALADIEERFARIDADGTERLGALDTVVQSLEAHSRTLHETLQENGGQSDALAIKAEALLLALDAATREIDETLPNAWDRLTGHSTKAAETLNDISAKTEVLEQRLAAAHNNTQGITDNLSRHSQVIDETQSKLNAAHKAVHALNDAVVSWDVKAKSLSEDAHGALIDAMLRVRETAETASLRAKEALQSIVPEATRAMGDAAHKALSGAVQSAIMDQIKDVSQIADQAVASTSAATERLMRQMLTIRETSEAFDAQLQAADQKQQNDIQESLARKVALLIESLNSISIDVCGLLAQDVSDDAWSAYLKGDRSIFTRRAARLVGQSESRNILRHYDEDESFREHANRYIHDFEAMMRLVLHSRDSGPLSITLLSSDMGKLYVALAQAIERLRT